MIPVLKTSMPTWSDVAPLIGKIDKLMTYSNHGPIHNQYVDALAEYFQTSSESVCIVSSGTAGLVSCLLVCLENIPKERSAITVGIPNWTFPATVQAACALGCRVVLLDVDVHGALTPTSVTQSDQQIDIVIPVAPFGQFDLVDSWERYYVETGKHVIVDAAAGFFTARPLSIPIVISTHATKGFSTGEGGIVLCSDSKFIQNTFYASNFGFKLSRNSEYIGLNHKLSEFNCAYGLYCLRQVTSLQDFWTSQVDFYDCLLIGKSQKLKPFNRSYARTTYNIQISDSLANINEVIRILSAEHGIETRRWWSKPISCQGIGKQCIASSEYPLSYLLYEQVIGLPMGIHIDTSKQKQIVNAVLHNI